MDVPLALRTPFSESANESKLRAASPRGRLHSVGVFFWLSPDLDSHPTIRRATDA